MSSKRLQNTLIFIIGILSLSVILIQCTKDNINAPNIQRAVVNPDSTVYATFYDTVIIDKADPNAPRINDYIISTGVQSIVRTNCSSPACHGDKVKPLLNNYEQIMTMVTPGNPEGSKLYQLVTTSDVNKAMPPVNYGVDLSITEKTKIYNWIKHGATTKPGLIDFKPAAMAVLNVGCASASCHNQATTGGEWARRLHVAVSPGDTTNFLYVEPGGRVRNYSQLKDPKLTQVWSAYKDSVRKFYLDTVANASFRPVKTFTTPNTSQSVRGPLNTYDDILLDIMHPKGVRSNSSVVYTDANGKRYYARGDQYNTASLFLWYLDSTMQSANLRTKVWGTNAGGSMAYDDGGLTPSEVAIVKSWYFADPNIPDVWKYGLDGSGVFRYRATGHIIKK